MNINERSYEELLLEIENLRVRLSEAEETLRAIRSGEIDALVVSGAKGEQVFTLKGAEKPYRILIEQMEEGAAMLDTHNSILYCNRGFARILKKPLEKIIGTNITQYVLQAGLADFEELLNLGMQKSSHGENSFMAGDGTCVPVYLSLNSLYTDGLAAINLVAMDLTERKRAENDLQKAHDELEIRVNERTEELVKTNEILKTEIIERKQAEEALRESEQRWATTLASIGDAVISTDTEGRITFMNAVAEALTGWTFAGASKKPVTEIFNIFNGYTRRKADNPVTRVLHEGTIVGLANHTILVRKDGTEVPIDDSGAPIRDYDGKIMGVVLIFRDITERKMAEEALKQSEERFRSIFSQSPIGIGVYNAEGLLVDINEAAMTMFGIDRLDNLRGLKLFSSPTVLEEERRKLRNRERIQEEVVYDFDKIRQVGFYETSKTGISYFNRIITPLHSSSESEPYGYLVQVQAITERKLAEEALRKAHDELEQRVRERTAQLKNSLEEKEIMLREIHHRVKNNMQVISGLLMLQEEFSNDEKFIEMIKESQNRIATMAIIHEKLYRSESLSKIDFKEYIDDLVSDLFESYGFTESKVGLKVNAENISMGIDTAIPVGLIINELVSNSLKHAFPEGKKGEIEISLSSISNDMIELLVQDNGIGIPEGIDFRKTESLGLHIVNILVENQLHGEITMNNNNGTEFRIRFRRME